MKIVLEKIFSGEDLSFLEAELVGKKLIAGSISPEEAGAFLAALRSKGEAASELAGLASSFKAVAVKLAADYSDAVDCCGTGGDGYGTFNVSTCVAFVLAAGGVMVPKHGNRAVSSLCGSADVLEELGIAIDLPSGAVEAQLKQHNFSFLMAPIFHPSFKFVAPIRKNLRVRTVFNLLGPLLNPARVERQLIGVFDASLLDLMATTTQLLGAKNVMVVAAEDGMDELSICSPTQVAHLQNGKISRYIVSPEDFGLKRAQPKELIGGDAETNAHILQSIWGGEEGPRQDLVALNAGAGFLVAGVVNSLGEGIEKALNVLNSGQILDLLANLKNAKKEI